jgi:hypothetical protein
MASVTEHLTFLAACSWGLAIGMATLLFVIAVADWIERRRG